MLLAIDIGNTTTSLGVYHGAKMAAHFAAECYHCCIQPAGVVKLLVTTNVTTI